MAQLRNIGADGGPRQLFSVMRLEIWLQISRVLFEGVITGY